MPKPPKELTKQIETIEGVIASLNNLLNTDKIKVQYYGKDFVGTLSELQQEALALRVKLETFKNELEESLTSQYDENMRFATERVVKAYLSTKDK